MNKPLLVTALALLVGIQTVLSAAPTIRRVNNNPGVTGVNVYASVQDAHDAALDDDIIIVEPSTVGYGTLNCTKRLKIFGNGYFLSDNPELNVNPSPSSISYVYFHPGSDSSEIAGISASYIQVYGANKVRIKRNNASSIDVFGYTQNTYIATNVDETEISQNYASSISINTSSSYGVISNTMVSNNIVYYNITATDQFKISNLIVRNNTILYGSVNVSNAVFENNIYLPTTALTTYNTTVSYNVGSGTLPAGTGNQSNVVMTNEFLVATNASVPAGVSADERWKVVDGSVLKTAGNGGIEVGAYGDVNPYVTSGISARPTILNMVNSGSGSGASPLDVTITIKSNN
jgi:hypothetical protein